MNTDQLLAKSTPQILLKEHIDDGIRIWRQLQNAFPKIKNITSIDFWKLLYISIVFHDLGKGHSEFQKILRNDKNNNWFGQRHELFSVPFVSLLNLNRNDDLMVKRIITGHHKSYSQLLRDYISPNYPRDNREFLMEFDLVNQPKIFEILSRYKYCSNLSKDLLVQHPSDIIHDFKEFVSNNKICDYFDCLLLIGAFKHCDHLASAFIKKLYFIELEDF